MGQNITKAVKGMVADANKEITTIPISDALNLVDSPNHIIVDLRDIRELQRTGKIPGAFSCPRGMLEFWIDPASPYHKKIFNQDLKNFILQKTKELVIVADTSWK